MVKISDWQFEFMKDAFEKTNEPIICSTCKHYKTEIVIKHLENVDLKTTVSKCDFYSLMLGKPKKLDQCSRWEICNQVIIKPEGDN